MTVGGIVQWKEKFACIIRACIIEYAEFKCDNRETCGYF